MADLQTQLRDYAVYVEKLSPQLMVRATATSPWWRRLADALRRLREFWPTGRVSGCNLVRPPLTRGVSGPIRFARRRRGEY